MATLSPLQKRAQRKARNSTAMDMNLVALIDVFTILIFFLLSSATGVETLVSPKAVELPLANSIQAPKDTVVLVVAGDEILADGRRVALVSEALASKDDLIPGLKAELDVLASRQAVRAENRERLAAEGQAVTIMADKTVPYQLLRKVMATCARANFSDVSFAVRQRVEG
ncbi:ExbD/TolR family protein [Rubrivivax rivuli]|jgi:biopolymer transport protein ExbD|uniref:Biopolymer transporter ExbD n=1 Tax=Rubrivivax rivuli TaxID=1862385 RepID=A0A437RSG5_9BURK|nr:biopolymer transporter ExbD [Rubrivivax rivuli]RVU49707.1 biopolymer transporter ExbD [Rubrivivax rivuli]